MFVFTGLAVGGLIPLLVIGNKYLTVSDWDIYGVYGLYGSLCIVYVVLHAATVAL